MRNSCEREGGRDHGREFRSGYGNTASSASTNLLKQSLLRRGSCHPRRPRCPVQCESVICGLFPGTFFPEIPSGLIHLRWFFLLPTRTGRISHSYNPRLDNEDVNHHSRQKFGYPAAVCPMGSGRMYEMVRGDGNIWPPRDSVQTTVMANQYSFNSSVFP